MTGATEQRQVLDMLAEGKINSDEAERLLARLAELAQDDAPNSRPAPSRRAHGTQLRVSARSEDGEVIDVRIPLHLLSTGIELRHLLPEVAREAIEETGIELDELNKLPGDVLAEALRDLEVEVDSEDGSTLSIRCE
jgi:hypothetical protein